MDKLNPQSKSPLSISLQLLKQGDLKSSHEMLGITAEQAKEIDFVNCMMAFEQGLNLLLTGHHTESIAPLRKAIPLIQITNDQEAKFIVPTLASFAEGISSLLQGDAHNAVKLLRLSSDAIQRLNFFMPGMEKLLLSFKASAEIALVRTYINVGNMAEGESKHGKVNQIYEELLAKLDETNPEDFPYFNEVYGTQIEFTVLLMRIDLEALDFDSLDRRIEYSKTNMSNLKKFINKIPNSPIKDATEIIQILFDIFEIYSRIGRQIILNRQPLAETEIRELLEVDKKLFECHQKANNAGDRGKLFLYTINQLKRLQESFLDIGKIQKKDFGRISGLITLGALIIQIVIVHITIHPTGNSALLFFLGELMISLIVGFGYGALKFKPLIDLYTEVVKSTSDKIP